MTQPNTYVVQGKPIPEDIYVLLKERLFIPKELEIALNAVLQDYKKKEESK